MLVLGGMLPCCWAWSFEPGDYHGISDAFLPRLPGAHLNQHHDDFNQLHDGALDRPPDN